ncbi:MAG: prefoldin subunit alpha [Candidatus Woesearchaeota archaeon]|nr:prefoldin subunit alpha [Candidatus Woesearchaeota archaeon]
MKQELQEKYIELQILDQTIRQIQQQLSILDQQLFELQRLNENLDEISKVNINSEILTPLGAGVFIKTQLKDNKDIFMNVGSNIITKKTVEESKNIINEQLQKIKLTISEMEEEITHATINAANIQQEISEANKDKPITSE